MYYLTTINNSDADLSIEAKQNRRCRWIVEQCVISISCTAAEQKFSNFHEESIDFSNKMFASS